MIRFFAAVSCVVFFGWSCFVAAADEPKVALRKAVASFGPGAFQAPSLDELDARAEWEERPVVDALKAMQEEWKRTKPAVTVAEARALRNDSAAANAKILDALGRPPENAAEVDYEATFTRVLARDVHSTNPILMNSVEDGEVTALTSFGLFGFDWNLRPYAAAETVTSWQTSKDRLYDKVVLRDDCTWSDGLPITAQDVVFSLRTILDPRVPIPAVRGMAEELRGVAAYDERTLVFFHKQASPASVFKMAFPVIPKHVYEAGLDEDPTLRASEYHQKLENFPIVGGAYKITQRTPGKDIVLQRRDDYFMHDGKQVRDKPYFATIRFRVIDDPARALDAAKAGEIDEVRLTPEQWLNETGDAEFDARATKVRGVEWVYFYFGWNLNHPSAPFFKELKVRQALGYAFDHETMLEKICHGLYEPSAGIFHADAKFAPRPMPAAYAQDVARAAKLLDEAGWKDRDGDGVRDKRIDGKLVPLEFTMICSAIPQRVAICELLARNLKDVGIECRVQAMENGQLSNQLVRHDYQANFGGWGTGVDPSTLKNVWKTGEGRNFNQYSNPKVDEILAEAETEFDPQKRDALYAKSHELIYADQPVTFLYTQSSFYAFDKRLRGYRFSPRGPYAYGPGVGSFWKVREP